MIKKILIAAGVILLALLAAGEFLIMLAPRDNCAVGQGLYSREYSGQLIQSGIVHDIAEGKQYLYLTGDKLITLVDGYSYEDGAKTERIVFYEYRYSCTTAIHPFGNFYFRDDDVASFRYFPDGTVPLVLSRNQEIYAEYCFEESTMTDFLFQQEPDVAADSVRMTVKGGEGVELDGVGKFKKESDEAEFLALFGYLNSVAGR